MLIPNSYHSSWDNFMTSERKQQLEQIESLIGTGYTPSADKVLRFLQLDLDSVKVVILGQDPYKPDGVANGRAFQPSNLTSWTAPFRQVSLKNILRAIYAAYKGINTYSKIPSYSDIDCLMVYGQFPIKQPREWFDSLESQGVLLLNTSLTCRIGESNSHQGIWFDFGRELISYIAKYNPNLIWFLWGKDAISCQKCIGNSKVFKSRHPMMCSESYPDDFLRNTCFQETMNIINWLG